MNDCATRLDIHRSGRPHESSGDTAADTALGSRERISKQTHKYVYFTSGMRTTHARSYWRRWKPATRRRRSESRSVNRVVAQARRQQRPRATKGYTAEGTATKQSPIGRRAAQRDPKPSRKRLCRTTYVITKPRDDRCSDKKRVESPSRIQDQDERYAVEHPIAETGESRSRQRKSGKWRTTQHPPRVEKKTERKGLFPPHQPPYSTGNTTYEHVNTTPDATTRPERMD